MQQAKWTIVGAAALGVMGAAAAVAQTPPVIDVSGRAELRLPAEEVTLSAYIFVREDTRDASLQAASDRLEAITDGVSRLEGLARYRFDTENAETSAVWDSDCRSTELYLDRQRSAPDACAPLAYVTTLSLSLEVEPAGIAGDVLSGLGELGADNASIVEFSLIDRAAAERRAVQAATQDALASADAIAEAAGLTLGPVQRISTGGGSSDRVIVTGSRFQVAEDAAAFAPAAPLDLPEPIVDVRATVSVTFAIEGAND